MSRATCSKCNYSGKGLFFFKTLEQVNETGEKQMVRKPVCLACDQFSFLKQESSVIATVDKRQKYPEIKFDEVEEQADQDQEVENPGDKWVEDLFSKKYA
jgi:hypothetical protein